MLMGRQTGTFESLSFVFGSAAVKGYSFCSAFNLKQPIENFIFKKGINVDSHNILFWFLHMGFPSPRLTWLSA